MSGEHKCENCETAHSETDLFCENCGYDFITGSLPSLEADHAPIPAQVESIQSPRPDSELRILVRVEVSSEYFGHAVSGSELSVPDPVPTPAELSFGALEVHIGRTSESRGIHPDIDVAEITADPAVSSRHAVIRVGANDSVAITDLGSTNGTVIGDPSGDPVEPNVPTTLTDETWVYLGAWTRLSVQLG